ncbi:MAG: FAD-linked oxidase C-terminal domain-containing protein [Burkholderiaceae bacterium]
MRSPRRFPAAVVSFPTIRGAIDAVVQTIQLGVPIARSEFLDARAIGALNAYSKLTLKEQPTLFFEFHGTEAGVREQVEMVQEIARDHGGNDFEWATRPEDRTRLWTARHNAYFACLQMRPGSRAISTDACVPISRLTECLEGASEILARSTTPTAIVGHVGDGNFHCIILLDPDNPDEVHASEALNDELVRLAIGLEGTCTGEHGIGLHKIGYLLDEAGEEAVAMMRRLKRALDPDNILNPGKIFSF